MGTQILGVNQRIMPVRCSNCNEFLQLTCPQCPHCGQKQDDE